ncbi:hypothetical protein RJ639_002530 [Escallonia herrerae]|uniref:Protein kinase domain-containing protein n=1 Tax=Escallonia herrerae TaxID=1293975 RepID=A0AA88XB32_9ASTE|nr:hypothetical protein RJ639_002530 [Escallonia herrerae]
MGLSSFFVILSISWSFLSLGTHQLQPSQKQVLLQLRKQLEYPKQLDMWYNSSTDLCFLSSPEVNVTCQENFVTELRILGDRPNKVRNFGGFAIPSQSLSENFSLDSFVATLSRLTSLRGLSLISLGIWGPVPEKIYRLSSLEFLDWSWNFMFGTIPPTFSRMVKLQSITLDGNFLNGSFPSWFDSVPNLTSLSLKQNRISGSLPSSIQKISSLTYLALSNNEISGNLPDLSSLTSLFVLDLSDNLIHSELPSLPKGLAMAFLSNNSFSGKIPQPYTQLNHLQQLDLSFNSLQGTPPTAIFALPNMTTLNLASNMLSGSLPNHLSCGSKLRLVDISNNRLRGSLPSCLSTALDNRAVKYSGNCLLTDLRDQHAETYCTESLKTPLVKKESGGKNVGVIIGVIGGFFILLVLLAFGFLVLCRRCFPRGKSEQHLLHSSARDISVTGFPSELITSARFFNDEAKLGTQGIPVHRLFSFSELKEATNNFDKSTVLGEAVNIPLPYTFLPQLYKGRLENGIQVAIRQLTVSRKYTTRNLKLRLDLLAKLRHPHLVCLLGHCIDGEGFDDSGPNKVYLIYEYIANGNYRSHLSEKTPQKVINWSDRLAVLIGIAKAIHFLHTGLIPGFFSNRLKANNILLNEHRMAKLSDYGLSIVAEEIDEPEVCISDVRFSVDLEMISYLSNAYDSSSSCIGETRRPRLMITYFRKLVHWPNYTMQMKSLEDDVFSFGFILLESLAGPSVSARKEAFLLSEKASYGTEEDRGQFVDPIVLASCSQESLSIVISITNKCITSDSSARPSLEDVLWNLQYAAQVQETAEEFEIRVIDVRKEELVSWSTGESAKYRRFGGILNKERRQQKTKDGGYCLARRNLQSNHCTGLL